MISCITPHIGEEMWEKLGHNNTIAYEKWPSYNETKLVKNTVQIAVQICGKMRGTIEIDVNLDEKQIEEIALNADFVKSRIEGKQIKKIIVIKNKIVNIVAI